MFGLNVEEVISIVKIIDLNTKVFTKKIMVVLIFKINSSNIHAEIASINQDTIVLF